MSAEWPIVKLGNFSKKIGSGATPRGGSSVYLDSGEISLIRSQNVYNDGFKPAGLVFIDSEAAKKLSNVAVAEGDVLLNITGDSVARVCLARARHLPARVNQHVAIIRPNPSDFDARYLRYFLASPLMQDFLLVLSSSGATRNALTKGMLEDLDVPKPGLVVQQGIADLLESLDDKIELNRQINQTLDQMAQTIFKSWFVDFDPVHAKVQAIKEGRDPIEAAAKVIGNPVLDQAGASVREIAALFPSEFEESELGSVPKGWGVADINNSTSIIIDHRGKTPKKLGGDWAEKGVPALSAKNIKSGGIVKRDNIRFVDNALYQKWMRDELEKGDILLTSEAPLGEMYYLASDDKYCLSQRLYALRAKQSACHPAYLYYWLQSLQAQTDLEGRATGTTVVGIRQSELRKVNVLLPDRKINNVYGDFVAGLLETVDMNCKENLTLAEIRDNLLPKLLSGEIRVGDAEQQIAEVF